MPKQYEAAVLPIWPGGRTRGVFPGKIVQHVFVPAFTAHAGMLADGNITEVLQ